MVDGDRTPNEQLETLKRKVEEVISDMEEDRDDLFTELEDVEEAGGARDEEKADTDIIHQMRETGRELAEANAKLHVILQAISVMEKGEELLKNIEVV